MEVTWIRNGTTWTLRATLSKEPRTQSAMGHVLVPVAKAATHFLHAIADAGHKDGKPGSVQPRPPGFISKELSNDESSLKE